MAFTYSSGEASALHQVRGIVGDTAEAGHFIEDETIAAILTANADAVGVSSVEVCRRILAKIAKDVDRSHPDGISTSRTQRSQQYRDLLRELEDRYGHGAPGMFVGGGSVAESETFTSDSDNVQPGFARGMWGEP